MRVVATNMTIAEAHGGLSSRGQNAAKPDPAAYLWEIYKNPWHPENNPSGFVNLGVAENVRFSRPSIAVPALTENESP